MENGKITTIKYINNTDNTLASIAKDEFKKAHAQGATKAELNKLVQVTTVAIEEMTSLGENADWGFGSDEDPSFGKL